MSSCADARYKEQQISVDLVSRGQGQRQHGREREQQRSKRSQVLELPVTSQGRLLCTSTVAARHRSSSLLPGGLPMAEDGLGRRAWPRHACRLQHNWHHAGDRLLRLHIAGRLEKTCPRPICLAIHGAWLQIEELCWLAPDGRTLLALSYQDPKEPE